MNTWIICGLLALAVVSIAGFLIWLSLPLPPPRVDILVRPPMPIPQHVERIVCPKCISSQNAVVYHTEPFYTYVHECSVCGCIITENDWDLEK